MTGQQRGTGTDWLRSQARNVSEGGELAVSEATAALVEVEAWLQSHKVEYAPPTMIPMVLIDEKKSRQNQARKDPLVTDSVERYAQAFKDGAIFPPIVVYPLAGRLVIIDGNNRQAGARRAGIDHISGIVVAESTPSELLQLLTVEANARHGVTPDVAWRVRQALHLATVGFSDTQAARAAAVTVQQIRTARAVLEADARARELRINGFAELPTTSRQALGVLKDAAVFYQAAQTAITTGMTIDEIRNMTREIKLCASEAERLAVVTRIANDRSIEAATKKTTGKNANRVSSPKTALTAGIGLLLKVKEADLVRAIQTAHDRDLLKRRLATAVDKILNIQVAMEPLDRLEDE